MTHIKHLFFDLDHTLWDFEKNSDKTFEFLFKKHKIAASLKKFLYYYKNINLKYWELYRNEKISKNHLKIGRLKDSFAIIKHPISNSMISLLADEYLAFLPANNHLFEGAIETLTYLHKKYQLHIITNGFNDVQFQKLKTSNLFPFFKEIITSENAGTKKPNPFIFKYALQKAETLAKNAMMIGDNWEADVMGAIAVGMEAVYFNPKQKAVSENICSISHLTELKKIL